VTSGPLTLLALNRALLDRQLLLRRAALPDDAGRAGRVVETVKHLVGLQAQAPFPPYYGLWSRLAGFRPPDLAELITGRRVVRIALMRGTIHRGPRRGGPRRPVRAAALTQGSTKMPSPRS
jgi:Winged helix DNA-binding domain